MENHSRTCRIRVASLGVAAIATLFAVPTISLAIAGPASADSFVEGFTAHATTSSSVGANVTNSVELTWQNSTSTPLSKTLVRVELVPTCDVRTVFGDETHSLDCSAPDLGHTTVVSGVGAKDCAGRTFGATLVDAAVGKWQLIANDGRGPVTYTSANNSAATCEVDFVVHIDSQPAVDLKPTVPLVQTRYGVAAVTLDNSYGYSDGGSSDMGLTVGL